MINLKEKPFYLNDEDINWVHSTLSFMSTEEKLGQIFIDLSYGNTDENFIKDRVNKTNSGGLRYVNLEPNELLKHNNLYQKHSKIPLLIAANAEAGGNGVCKGGTMVGCEIKIAATGDYSYGYQLGLIGGTEAKAVGCNWSFTPIADLSLNWRNPIISTRTWGDKTKDAINYSKECIRGLHDAGVVATAKHFPGDGVDERDHHYSSSVNTMSVEEWDNTFGEIYKELIDYGVDSIMVGHIMLPEYQKKFNPDMSDNEIMPASLCKELLSCLLRGKLKFNGLIVTDATHMVGMTGRMARKNILAQTLNAGCDMILFYNDYEEDVQYMRENLQEGKINIDTIDKAVIRILALKASLGLHKKEHAQKTQDNLACINCESHIAMAKEISDKSITLAKQVGENIFPINADKYKRVLIVPVNTQVPEFAKFTGAAGNIKDIAEKLQDKLNAFGFCAQQFVSPLLKDYQKSESKNPYDYKENIENFKQNYDLVLTIANCSSFGVTQRLSWDTPKGGLEIPWYVHEIPTVFISFNSPFHLADVPQVKNYINCYDSQEWTIDLLIDKLMGRSSFKGISPVDVFCNLVDTKL